MAPGAGEDRSGAAETPPASHALIEDGTLVLTDVRQGSPAPARETALPSFDGRLVIPPGTPADESLQLSVYDF